jgi:hypothetical protein
VNVPATTFSLDLDDSPFVNEASLEAGMCISWLPPGELALVISVSCEESHRYEVFAVVDSANQAADYAGPDEVYALGYDACLERFFGYVGESHNDSPWQLEVIPPTERQWVENGDRAATCLLFQPGADGPKYSKGSARGSA